MPYNMVMPYRPSFDANAVPVAGAKAYLYYSGTTTLAPVYSDSGLTTPAANPVVANGSGRFPQRFLDYPAIAYRLYITNAAGTLIEDFDPYDPSEQGTKGDPGGNVMSIGTVEAAVQMKIADGADVVQVSGYAATRDALAGYRFIADPSVDEAYEAAHPETSFRDSTGKGFLLLDQGRPRHAREWIGGRTTRNSVVLNRMFEDLCADSEGTKKKRIDLEIDDKWELDDTVVIPKPVNVHITAFGANFNSDYDELWFDCNGAADPLFENLESAQHFRWKGGSFNWTGAADAEAACPLRVVGFRNAWVTDTDVNGEGPTAKFHRALIVGPKDTLYIRDNKFYACKKHIEEQPFSFVGGPLMFIIEDNHFSARGAEEVISGWSPWSNFSIRNCSFNCGDDFAGDAIHLRRTATCILTPVTGAFAIGDTVSGLATNGSTVTGVVVQLYAGLRYNGAPFVTLALKGGSAALNFAAGATLTATSGSGATGTVLLSQNAPQMSNGRIGVGSAMHFEAGQEAAAGARGIVIEDLWGVGAPIVDMQIDVGTLGLNAGGGGAIGCEFVRVQSSAIVGGRFVQTTGNTPVKFSSNCADWKIHRSNTTFSSGEIDLNGMDVEELDRSDWNYRAPRNQSRDVVSVTVADPTAVSPTTVDMASAYADYKTVFSAPPLGYTGFATIEAATGSTATNARLRVFNPLDTAPKRKYAVHAAGLLDGEPYTMSLPWIPADGDGNFAYDVLNVGGGDVEITITITGMFFS